MMNLDGLIPGMTMEDLAAWVAGAGAFAVVLLIWSAFVERDPLTARLKSLQSRRDVLKGDLSRTARKVERPTTKMSVMRRIVERLKLARGKTATDAATKLSQAGFRSKDALTVYLFAKACLPLLLGGASVFVVYVLKPFTLDQTQSLAACLTAMLLGSLSPDYYLRKVAERRLTVIRRNLPDVFDLLVICAEAGLSLDASFDRVARELGEGCPELAEEVGLTAVELGFLPDRSKALQGFAERVPLDGVRALVTTLAQTERYGTPLAQALRVLATEMRNERMLKAEEKAARLPAIMTLPMMIFILPPLFIVLIGPAILRTIDGMAKL
ncbi:type II secretion system F family protein [Azospirillum soli]|uniref:type II secretion system F family protein n=1 Tax=Azospirillum soli TaxID=1304799 RepID=UPI001AE10BE8|nr:type II secretion system F family protein [Azospirillum soli]MBP2310995.1 tight adherence protein C [Azospirillum soli]